MNILLAIDNSPHSFVAVEVVLNRLWPPGSTFKVFCAVERREPVFAVMTKEEATNFLNKALEAAKQFTADIASKLKQRFPDCDAISEAIFGDSKESILAQTDWPADLIVVGSHGRHGLPRFFLGSVSQTVLLHASCSTLIARYQDAHAGVPEFDKNILVAIDNTPHSNNVLHWILQMPWPEDARFTLLSVMPALVEKYSDGIDALYARKFSGERFEMKEATQSFLQQSANLLNSKLGSGRASMELLEGDPAESILSFASSLSAGLVVMGSRSHGHVARIFMGSVSQEVVLRAPCPVEVVKRASDA